MTPVTYVVHINFLLMRCVIPVLRHLLQSPIISANDLIVQREQPPALPSRSTEQKAREWKK